MSKYVLDLAELTASDDDSLTAKTFKFIEPQFWEQILAENKIGAKILVPLSAQYTVIPVKSFDSKKHPDKPRAHTNRFAENYFIRGQLTGEIAIPCDRCFEDTRIVLNSSFELHESLKAAGSDILEESHLHWNNKRPELDIGDMLFEQFVLFLPVKPLCSTDCQGLCPLCGQNLNETYCSCHKEEIDPRLAVLKQWKKKN